MAAVNKDPFVYSRSKDGSPQTFLGLVQAGATQAIKVGEICTWDETTGYFSPVDAVADHRYILAIAKEEQKATGRAELTASRYIEFYALNPNDVFEFAIDASRTLAIGDSFTLTASDSQKLTYAAAAFPVAISVGFSNYPQEEDTTIASASYAQVKFNPTATWHGYRMDQTMRPGKKFISMATSETLIESDMYNSVVLFTAQATATLPVVKPGMDVTFIAATADDVNIDPNAADKIRLDGALLDNGDKLSSTTIGHYVRLITEGADGFCAIAPVGTWTDGS